MIMNAEPITVEEAKRRLDEGDAITFVDSRNEGAWRKSEWQLPDSRRVPAGNVEAHLDAVPPGGGLIVPYGDPDDVAAVSRVLARHGWTNVRPLLGGADAWRRAGYPTESKPTRTLSPAEVSANVQKAEGD
jgi:rhodanese-related sulfurtransferase